MTNITLSVNENILKKARRIAMDKHTTVTAMIRNFLNALVTKEDIRNSSYLSKLRKTFFKFGRSMEKPLFKREDLYDRFY